MQKDSHSTEVGQTAGDHVSESRLLLADRRSRDAPVGAVSANHCITNRKSVPPSQKRTTLDRKAVKNQLQLCALYFTSNVVIGYR